MTAGLTTGDVELVHQPLVLIQPTTALHPLGLGQWLQALAYAPSKPREIATVGEPESVRTQALLDVVRDGYQPFQVVALGALDAQPPAVALLQDRGLVFGFEATYRRGMDRLSRLVTLFGSTLVFQTTMCSLRTKVIGG